jgi:hypothetical protein
LVKPVTTQLVAPVVVQVKPPLEAVTVYPVMDELPGSGAVQETRADMLLRVAVTALGAPGRVTTWIERFAVALGAIPLLTVTVNGYAPTVLDEPEKCPALDREMPGGRDPEVTVKDTAGTTVVESATSAE